MSCIFFNYHYSYPDKYEPIKDSIYKEILISCFHYSTPRARLSLYKPALPLTLNYVTLKDRPIKFYGM